jgi:hypothetical protein
MRILASIGLSGLLVAGLSGLLVAGCSRVEFADGWTSGSAHYYDPVPYLVVTLAKDCSSNASVLLVPGKQRSISFSSGYGTSNLSANFQGGMLSSVGQQTDTKIPETITALTGLATAVPKLAAPAPGTPIQAQCTPKAMLYPIKDGQIDTTSATQIIVN